MKHLRCPSGAMANRSEKENTWPQEVIQTKRRHSSVKALEGHVLRSPKKALGSSIRREDRREQKKPHQSQLVKICSYHHTATNCRRMERRYSDWINKHGTPRSCQICDCLLAFDWKDIGKGFGIGNGMFSTRSKDRAKQHISVSEKSIGRLLAPQLNVSSGDCTRNGKCGYLNRQKVAEQVGLGYPNSARYRIVSIDQAKDGCRRADSINWEETGGGQ